MTARKTYDEPTVEEMLADPIVRLVMKRDGVEAAEIRRILQRLAAARAAGVGPISRPGSSRRADAA